MTEDIPESPSDLEKNGEYSEAASAWAKNGFNLLIESNFELGSEGIYQGIG